MDKQRIHAVVVEEVSRRVTQLNELLQDALIATAGETKSTAGDKHETSRAMAQLEQEKIGGQLSELNKLQETIYRIDPAQVHETIQLGSLVNTSNGWFYLSVGIGGIEMDSTTIFCMTPAAPLGKLLLGKKTGDVVDWQGKKIEILQVQ